MYSIHNEGKSVVVERFMKTLKTKIYKYMTSISKNVYINKLDHIVNQYNNRSHRTIKMKTADVKNDTYIDSNKEVNEKDPKFKPVKKVISYMSNRKVMIVHLIAGLIKKTKLNKCDFSFIKNEPIFS